MKNTDIFIIGSGPAGFTSAIYAARAGVNVTLATGMQIGGQLTVTTDVENYPGFADTIQGPWLMEQMQMQAQKVGVNIVQRDVIKVELLNKPYLIQLDDDTSYSAKTVIASTGAQAKWLNLPSEQKYRGYGVSGCATCDAFFYKNKKVLVVGGGNVAVEDAMHLTKFASHVTLIHRRDSLRAEKILQDRLFSNNKIQIIWDTALHEVLGDGKFVTGAELINLKTNAKDTLDVEGIFIAIGHAPNTGLFKGQLALDEEGYIITSPGTTKTNLPGVFAAGDVQDKIYRQAVTAAGTGCMAALDAVNFLNYGH